MTRFKFVCLISCLVVVPLAFGTNSFAKSPQDSAKAPATTQDVHEALNKYNYKNMMEMLEAVAAKYPGHDGPTHLHPKNKIVLKKTFLPHYFDTLDSLHSGKTSSIKASFVSGKGDQSQTVEPLDLTNIFLFLSKSKNGLDKPMSEDLWGSLTPRELFTALEFPKVEHVGVEINYSKGRAKPLKTDISLSESHFSLQAKDASGLWVYSLDMPIDSNSHSLKLTTKDYTETYTLDGMSTDMVQSIKINNKAIFTKPITTKISDKLRVELGL